MFIQSANAVPSAWTYGTIDANPCFHYPLNICRHL
jgi:hypothetical protein